MSMMIEKANYEGYVWYSDETMPRVLDGSEAFEPNLKEGENPFIVEAQLYDALQMKSYSIRFWNGGYHVVCYDVPKNVCKLWEVDIVTYGSNRMNNNKLLFWQQWKEVEDNLCLGMKTLVPKALVFVGLKK